MKFHIFSVKKVHASRAVHRAPALGLVSAGCFAQREAMDASLSEPHEIVLLWWWVLMVFDCMEKDSAGARLDFLRTEPDLQCL